MIYPDDDIISEDHVSANANEILPEEENSDLLFSNEDEETDSEMEELNFD
jgi:hypothetical protein